MNMNTAHDTINLFTSNPKVALAVFLPQILAQVVTNLLKFIIVLAIACGLGCLIFRVMEYIVPETTRKLSSSSSITEAIRPGVLSAMATQVRASVRASLFGLEPQRTSAAREIDAVPTEPLASYAAESVRGSTLMPDQEYLQSTSMYPEHTSVAPSAANSVSPSTVSTRQMAHSVQPPTATVGYEVQPTEDQGYFDGPTGQRSGAPKSAEPESYAAEFGPSGVSQEATRQGSYVSDRHPSVLSQQATRQGSYAAERQPSVVSQQAEDQPSVESQQQPREGSYAEDQGYFDETTGQHSGAPKLPEPGSNAAEFEPSGVSQLATRQGSYLEPQQNYNTEELPPDASARSAPEGSPFKCMCPPQLKLAGTEAENLGTPSGFVGQQPAGFSEPPAGVSEQRTEDYEPPAESREPMAEYSEQPADSSEPPAEHSEPLGFDESSEFPEEPSERPYTPSEPVQTGLRTQNRLYPSESSEFFHENTEVMPHADLVHSVQTVNFIPEAITESPEISPEKPVSELPVPVRPELNTQNNPSKICLTRDELREELEKFKTDLTGSEKIFTRHSKTDNSDDNDDNEAPA